MDIDNVRSEILAAGATGTALLEVEDIKIYPEFRDICEKNACRAYGTNWACPPATGTVEECTDKLKKYKHAIMIQYVHELIDSYDFEGMEEGAKKFKKIVFDCKKIFSEAYNGEFLVLGAGGCRTCEKCTYPDSECRHPEDIIHSMEAYCMNVMELTREAGLDYHWSNGKVYYAGMILYN